MLNSRLAGLLAGCSVFGIASSAAAQPVAEVTEIVVTANKREERLQDVPVTLAVVADEQLARQNIADIGELSRAAANLNNVPGPGGGLRIRGIGTSTFSRSSEGSVGVVIDGVALANATSSQAPTSLFDVARVEVLEGPQGMLFGRNASAGVLNIVTKAPSTSAFEAIAHADIGSRESGGAQLALNFPLGDDLALRLTGGLKKQAYSTYNMVRQKWDQTEQAGVRARLLWRPSDKVDVNLSADYDKTHARGTIWAVKNVTPGSFLANQLTGCAITPSDDNTKVCLDGPVGNEFESYGASAQIDYSLGDYVLTSITAHRTLKTGGEGGDSDSVPLDILNINRGGSTVENFSQELRLTSPAGERLEYVLGLYYFDGDQQADGLQQGSLRAVPPPLTLGQGFRTDISSKTYAAFGQATLHAMENLRLIAGARLNRDEVSASTVRAVAPGAVAPFGSVAPVSGSTSDDSLSYRLGAQYDLTDDVMSYLTYARGYKGAAINDQATNATAPLIVRPEIPKAWELGLKSNLLDRRLALNIALFHTKVEDFQTQFYDAAATAFVYGNAPSLTSKGVSVNAFGEPLDGFNVNAGLVYTDATYGKGYLVACAPGQAGTPGCVGGVTDASGAWLTGTPRWKVTLSGEYARPVTPEAEAFVQADAVYTSEIRFSAAPDVLSREESHVVLGGRIGVRELDGRWGVSVYVRNLLDERIPTFVIATPLAAQLVDLQSHSQFFGPESYRTVGISLDARF